MLVLLAISVGAAFYAFRRFFSPEAVLARTERMVVISSGTISGSLDDTLRRHGLPESERWKISKVLSKHLNLRRLRAEDVYLIAFSTSARFKYLVIDKDLKKYDVLPSTFPAGYSVAVEEVALSSSVVRVAGRISNSLWESMSAQGIPPDLILDYADVFSWSVDFLTEVRAGDKYDLVYERTSIANGKIISKKILAAVYEGAETGRKIAGASGKGYYDENAESVRSLFLRAPLHYRRISSYFSYHRFHPVLKYVRPHLGIDYAAPSGTPVSAVADGVVTCAEWKGGFGNYVEIRHAAGYVTSYGHLRRFAGNVKPGRRVSQGDVIAYVGGTGMATGPHLDFRVRKDGSLINFLKIKYRSNGGLSGKTRSEYLSGLKKLLPEYF